MIFNAYIFVGVSKMIFKAYTIGIKHVVFFNAYTCIIKIKHDSLYYNIICIKKVLQG